MDLCCRPRAALHCFAAIVLPLCFVNPHVLGEARRAFYHVPGRVLVRFPHRAGPLLPGRVQLSHVRYHGHDMGTQPYLTDEQVARIRGEEPARQQKADAILKAHRAATKIAKARKLSPAFDAECQAADAKAKADAKHAARIARTAEIAQWSSTKQVLHLLKNVIVAFWLTIKPALKFLFAAVAAVVVGAAVGIAVCVGIALLWVFLWVLTQPGRSYRRRYYYRRWRCW